MFLALRECRLFASDFMKICLSERQIILGFFQSRFSPAFICVFDRAAKKQSG
jgi:hypothetical protein